MLERRIARGPFLSLEERLDVAAHLFHAAARMGTRISVLSVHSFGARFNLSGRFIFISCVFPLIFSDTTAPYQHNSAAIFETYHGTRAVLPSL